VYAVTPGSSTRVQSSSVKGAPAWMAVSHRSHRRCLHQPFDAPGDGGPQHAQRALHCRPDEVLLVPRRLRRERGSDVQHVRATRDRRVPARVGLEVRFGERQSRDVGMACERVAHPGRAPQ
jgi:hypothetical protein